MYVLEVPEATTPTYRAIRDMSIAFWVKDYKGHGLE